MRSLFKEYRDFINKGDVITVAVGLTMALYFQKIIDAILEGVINPIIAAIVGESSYRDIGFDIGDARISIGVVIDAIISFLLVALILFLIIKWYNNLKTAPGGAKETELSVLTDIRDELRAGSPGT
jgi:large conductance mechanosensitive channel